MNDMIDEEHSLLREFIVDEIIAMAWADDISFDEIKKNNGLSEPDVIKIMRHHLKPGSFKLWRKRVSGRSSKHKRKTKLLNLNKTETERL